MKAGVLLPLSCTTPRLPTSLDPQAAAQNLGKVSKTPPVRPPFFIRGLWKACVGWLTASWTLSPVCQDSFITVPSHLSEWLQCGGGGLVAMTFEKEETLAQLDPAACLWLSLTPRGHPFLYRISAFLPFTFYIAFLGCFFLNITAPLDFGSLICHSCIWAPYLWCLFKKEASKWLDSCKNRIGRVASLQVGSRYFSELQLISKTTGVSSSGENICFEGWALQHYTLWRSSPSSNPATPRQYSWISRYFTQSWQR